jgi:hypothetical protein
MPIVFLLARWGWGDRLPQIVLALVLWGLSAKSTACNSGARLTAVFPSCSSGIFTVGSFTQYANALPTSPYVVLGWCEVSAVGELFDGCGKFLQRFSDSLGPLCLAHCDTWQQSAVSETILQGLKRVSSYVGPFGTPCGMSVARLCKAIKYVYFSWHVQMLFLFRVTPRPRLLSTMSGTWILWPQSCLPFFLE